MANTPIHHTFAGLVGRDARSHTNRAAELLGALEAIQKRLRGMGEQPTEKDCVAFCDSVEQMLKNVGLDTSPLPAWTVFVRQANEAETIDPEEWN